MQTGRCPNPVCRRGIQHRVSAIDKISSVARLSGAGAVHRGFGFLAENDSFAQQVIDQGQIFIGPSPYCIKVMGHNTDLRRLRGRKVSPRFQVPMALWNLNLRGHEILRPGQISCSGEGSCVPTPIDPSLGYERNIQVPSPPGTVSRQFQICKIKR